jgi:carbon monoxide dehydrogenase subunit G
MADQTTSSITIAAPASGVMAVISDFGSYPQWATGVKQTDVQRIGPDGRPARVRFVLDATPIRDEYTLEYEWDGDVEVRWTLVEGGVITAMDGAYRLDPQGPLTRVSYRLAVDVAIPLIGLLKRKAEKAIVETALAGLKQRVEGPGSGG